MLIIGVIYWASMARVVRAQVKSLRERVYVKRVRSLGAGTRASILRHVLPQVAPLLVASTVLADGRTRSSSRHPWRSSASATRG